VKFLVDAQVPPALAVWLRDHGFEATHVQDLGMLAADDNEIWALALGERYVLVTKDHDFAEWAIKRRPCPQIIWLRFGNLGKGELIDRVAQAWPRVMNALNNAALVVEAL
jgi:predicted nuclease of predicted toxin-antitoxin system